MLSQNQLITNNRSKKRVWWADTLENNNLHPSKKQKLMSKKEVKQLLKTLETSFSKGTYEDINHILKEYSRNNIIQLFNINNYSAFRTAARYSNIEALKFIINSVPKFTLLKMAHYSTGDKFIPFRQFLINECALIEFNRFNKDKCIEGLKIFLQIDYESFDNFFKEFIEAFFPTEYTSNNSFDLHLKTIKRQTLVECFNIAKGKLIEDKTSDLSSYGMNVLTDKENNNSSPQSNKMLGNEDIEPNNNEVDKSNYSHLAELKKQRNCDFLISQNITINDNEPTYLSKILDERMQNKVLNAYRRSIQKLQFNNMESLSITIEIDSVSEQKFKEYLSKTFIIDPNAIQENEGNFLIVNLNDNNIELIDKLIENEDDKKRYSVVQNRA